MENTDEVSYAWVDKRILNRLKRKEKEIERQKKIRQEKIENKDWLSVIGKEKNNGH